MREASLPLTPFQRLKERRPWNALRSSVPPWKRRPSLLELRDQVPSFFLLPTVVAWLGCLCAYRLREPPRPRPLRCGLVITERSESSPRRRKG